MGSFSDHYIQNKTLTLFCESGQISTNNNYTQFGLVPQVRTRKYIHNLYNINCTDWTAFHYSIQNCYGKKECDVDFKMHWIKKECQTEEYLKGQNGFLKLFCDRKLNLKNNTLKKLTKFDFLGKTPNILAFNYFI